MRAIYNKCFNMSSACLVLLKLANTDNTWKFILLRLLMDFQDLLTNPKFSTTNCKILGLLSELELHSQVASLSIS